ncbi:hypothetical protein HID58_062905 [Brassica napus]|uniref:Uncharacterized protein n=2 Tax=Brassica TaxID=3705 RepID=A0ABQ8A2T8_BRANA|nr:hypothetical protein HID58_062905 [Brassica napus]
MDILYHNMASKFSAVTNAKMVIASPLYWESIELLAKDEILRGVFYAIPDGCKLHFLKRKIRASNEKEAETLL